MDNMRWIRFMKASATLNSLRDGVGSMRWTKMQAL